MRLVGGAVDVAAGVDGEIVGLRVLEGCEVDDGTVDGFEGVDAPFHEGGAGGVTGDTPLVVAALYHVNGLSTLIRRNVKRGKGGVKRRRCKG